MRLHLTDAAIARLKPTRGQVTYFDTLLPGFGLRVGKYRKTWIALLGKQRRRISLGHYPLLSLKDARDKARHLLLTKNLATSTTLQEAIDRFVLDHLRPNTKSSTAKKIERYLRVHFRHIERRPLSSITAQEVMNKIASMRTTPAEANNAFGSFKQLCNWAASHNFITDNPLRYTNTPYKTKPRERLLNDAEVQAIWHESYNHASFGQLIRCLILSGQRLVSIGVEL